MGCFTSSAVGNQKCSKCGSKKHSTAECTTDMAKVKCFRCGVYGHIGLNCSNKQDKGKGKGSGDKGRGKGYEKGSGKGKQNRFSRGKGKGFKGGRKGKLNELSSEQTWDDEQWWTDDSSWYWYEPGVEQVSYWNDYEWNEQTWDGQEYGENGQQGSETKPTEGGQGAAQGSQSVGSLVLSDVLGDFDKHVSEEFCSFSVLEQTSHEQHAAVLPFCLDAQLSFETKEGFCDDSFATWPEKCEISTGRRPERWW